MLRGCAGSASAAINATAGEHGDAGLTHADDVGTRPQYLQKGDDVIDKIVEPERAVLEADIASIVPVGDIDVMIGEEHLRRPAQQGGKMPRHRRHQKDARLRDCEVFFETQQGTKGRSMNHGLAYGDTTSADRHSVDAEGRPAMT